MSNPVEDLGTILLRRRVVSRAQLIEAQDLAKQTGLSLGQALIALGYATPLAVLEATAALHNLPFLDLTTVTIATEVLELMPESVAREIVVLPLELDLGTLKVVISDPVDVEKLQTVRFILNKDITPVLGIRDQIVEAINRYYGQSETESVDSMLAEFTDTAIDFAESVPRPATPEAVPEPPERPGRPVERRATVRHYHRMTPERMFPLLVVLSEQEVEQIVKHGVAQARGGRFRVDLDSVVEVEPILPGCQCYPPKEHVTIRPGAVTASFWVVPHVLGRVMQARVVLRQNGAVLTEVPLDVRVRRQTAALLLGGLSLLLPFVLLVLKHFRLDFESQLQDGFGLYAALANWLLRSLSPEVLTGTLLASTGAVYCWLRPRQRDVFWDVKLSDQPNPSGRSEPGLGERVWSPSPALTPTGYRDRKEQGRMIAKAEQLYHQGDYAAALRHYENGFAHGKASAVCYHHAALAAANLGQTQDALFILEEAAAQLGARKTPGVLWFNMACFATRLGRLNDAVKYLHQAKRAGYVNVDKIRRDPDLAPLRWRSDFKALLHSLRS